MYGLDIGKWNFKKISYNLATSDSGLNSDYEQKFSFVFLYFLKETTYTGQMCEYK